MRGARERAPKVTITAVSLRRLRAEHDGVRLLLAAVCLVAIASIVRTVVAPAVEVVHPAARAAGPARYVGAEAFAEIFARAYLTWNASEAGGTDLEQYGSDSLEGGLGRQAPPSGGDRVEWVAIAAASAVGSSEQIYTVEAQTDAAGLVDLAVPVVTGPGGRPALGGYPAFVGAPQTGPALPVNSGGEVDEAALQVVADRALRNYLAGDLPDLQADLADGTRLSVPQLGLSLSSVISLDWSQRPGFVVAVVHAAGAAGARFTLAYELRVEQDQGRWEVAGVETDPNP